MMKNGNTVRRKRMSEADIQKTIKNEKIKLLKIFIEYLEEWEKQEQNIHMKRIKKIEMFKGEIEDILKQTQAEVV